MNYYKTNEQTLISFSGGRTSAFMLYKVLEAYDGCLPDHFKVCFANTGKEMPQTLDFVRDCESYWNVPITWLEYDGRSKADDEKKYTYHYKIVTHDTASRSGEPFSKLIDDLGQLPNPRTRWCSGQLKVQTIDRYLSDLGFERPYLSMLGLRADEPRRAMRLLGKVSDGYEKILPLYRDKVTKETVFEFWENNDFDLGLPSINGLTDWGNCDLCFLKGQRKRRSIIEQRPDLAEWWIEQETKADRLFDSYGKSYKDLSMIATDNLSMFDDDESLPCFCGD